MAVNANDEVCKGVISMPESVRTFVTTVAMKMEDSVDRFSDTSKLCSMFVESESMASDDEAEEGGAGTDKDDDDDEVEDGTDDEHSVQDSSSQDSNNSGKDDEEEMDCDSGASVSGEDDNDL